MNEILFILAFLDAFLCIILFSKIWGMTNDVDKLKERFCTPYYTGVKKKFTEFYLCGEYEEAYKFLNHYLACETDKRFHNQSRTGNYYKEEFTEWCSKIIDRYSFYYEMIGKEIPENLKKVTFESYDKMAW